MSRNASAIRRRIGLALVLALSVCAGPAAANAPAFELAGHWLGSAGNSLDVTQPSAGTVNWVGTSGDGSWVHDYGGTISGAGVTGHFQDRPGHRIVQSGAISAHVTSDCSLTITHVAVDGGPSSSGGEVFTRTPCPRRSQGRFRFGFRIFKRDVDLSTGSHGSFTTRGQPNDDATLPVTSVSAKQLILRWKSGSRRWFVIFAFTGTGTYRTDDKDLYLKLAVKQSNVPSCRRRNREPSGLELQGRGVLLSICGEIVVFGSPEHASNWVKPA